MLTQDIRYAVGTKNLTGYLAVPDGPGKRAGFLICHQGAGLTEHTKERARMIAAEGHIGFALDLYGAVATSREQSTALLQELVGNPDELRRRALAGLAGCASSTAAKRLKLCSSS
jgi:dienelactone hydrolase